MIEELLELHDLKKGYEAAYEFEDVILLTKFRIEQLLPEFEKHSADDIVTIAPKKQDVIVTVTNRVFENSHLLNENSDLKTPLKEPHHEPEVSGQVVSYKQEISSLNNQVQAPVPVPRSPDCDPNDNSSKLPTAKITNNQSNENAVQEPPTVFYARL